MTKMEAPSRGFQRLQRHEAMMENTELAGRNPSEAERLHHQGGKKGVSELRLH